MKKSLIGALIVLAFAATGRAQDGSRINWPHYQDMAVDLMQQYLRINTSNPPGNEIEAARFFKKIFDQHGIENEIFEYKTGRANIIARLKGNGSKRPIILLSHTDVVTAEPASWEVDPAIIKNNAIYGRGALDMKGEGLLHLMTMILLKREGPPLSRDVIFLGTADEEVNDEGSLWMIANKADLFKNAEYLLTEGGDNLLEGESVKIVGVDVAEKAPFWLRLTATGLPGHGSRPVPDPCNESHSRLGDAGQVIAGCRTVLQRRCTFAIGTAALAVSKHS
jgi:acetylornithine deacetylase/succinyl-diaminopimelate desuccinylase-like protein